MLTLMRVAAYEPPAWPNGPQFQQIHLDLAAEDLDADVAAAVELGARQPQYQSAPAMSLYSLPAAWCQYW